MKQIVIDSMNSMTSIYSKGREEHLFYESEEYLRKLFAPWSDSKEDYKIVPLGRCFSKIGYLALNETTHTALQYIFGIYAGDTIPHAESQGILIKNVPTPANGEEKKAVWERCKEIMFSGIIPKIVMALKLNGYEVYKELHHIVLDYNTGKIDSVYKRVKGKYDDFSDSTFEKITESFLKEAI